MAWQNTVVTAMLTHWSYLSLTLSHHCDRVLCTYLVASEESVHGSRARVRVHLIPHKDGTSGIQATFINS